MPFQNVKTYSIILNYNYTETILKISVQKFVLLLTLEVEYSIYLYERIA